MNKIDEYKKVVKRVRINDFRRNLKIKSVIYKGRKCENCDYDKSITALQFHHLDPSKKDFTISKSTMSWDKIKSELDKCILLCSNCHIEEHERQRAKKQASEKILLKDLQNEIKENRICKSCKKPFSVRFDCKSQKCRSCNSKTTKIPRPSKKYLSELLNSMNLSDAASNLKVSVSTLKRICNELGVDKPKSKTIFTNYICKIEWPPNLGDLVWKYPLSKLSKTLGVSDTAIKKRCKNNNIELPPQGYWLRKI